MKTPGKHRSAKVKHRLRREHDHMDLIEAFDYQDTMKGQ
jgi:hypothetical protein